MKCRELCVAATGSGEDGVTLINHCLSACQKGNRQSGEWPTIRLQEWNGSKRKGTEIPNRK